MINQTTKTNIVSLTFAISCLMLYFFFPSDGLKFENIIRAFLFFLVLPILYVKIILHKNLARIGFTSFYTDKIHIFYIMSATIIGSLLSFGIVLLGWGVQKYLSSMSTLVFNNFGAFLFYELIFASVSIFLITFFAWGFVYSIKWNKKEYSFIAAFTIFIVLMLNFYGSFFMIMPLLIPMVFIQKIYNNKNIIYLFIPIFIIALILDVFIAKV